MLPLTNTQETPAPRQPQRFPGQNCLTATVAQSAPRIETKIIDKKMFEKSLQDLVKGIRAHKRDPRPSEHRDRGM